MTGGTAWALALHGGRMQPLAVPGSWEPLAWHRDEEVWTWRVIDRRTGQVVSDRLEGVESGDLRMNVFADTRGGGGLTWSGLADDMPTWRDVRVQPVYSATLLDGSEVSWPMGVYMCTSPETDYVGRYAQTQVSLYDLTLALRRARLTSTSGVRAGTRVVDHIRSVLAVQAPTLRHALEDSPAELRSSMVWDPDTTWLRVFNDLLDAAGMVGIWADVEGRIRSAPYVRPQERPHVWTFRAGAEAVHEEGLSRSEDDFEVPNRVTAISRADEVNSAMRVQVRLDDYDPTHPLSHAVTGEWFDRVETELEAASLEVLRSRAERLLLGGVSVSSTVKLRHAPLPLGLQDRVAVDDGPVQEPSSTIQSIDIPCTPGQDWTTVVRRVTEVSS